MSTRSALGKAATFAGAPPTESVLMALVGSWQEFMACHWNREPFVHRGSGEGYPSLLTLADLDAILAHRGLREPYVRLSAGGRPLHESRFMRPHKVRDAPICGMLDVNKVAAEFAAGATVILDGIDHYHPPIKRLCDQLSAELLSDVGAVAFISPGEVPGLTVHLDNTEVFVLQLHGSKHWKVHEQIRPLPRSGRVLNSEELGAPVLEVELKAGDCLYLPWGAPHSTVSGGTVSCHLSVMVSPPTWGDILSQAIDSQLATDVFEGVPIWRDGDFDWLLPEARARLRAATEGLAARDLGELLEAVVRRAAPRPAARRGFLQQMAKRAEISGRTVVTRSGVLGYQHRVVDDAVELQVGVRTFRYPGAARTTLDGLSGVTTAMVSEIPTDLEEPALLTLVGHLVDVGVLRIV